MIFEDEDENENEEDFFASKIRVHPCPSVVKFPS